MAGEVPGRAAESGTPPSARFALWTLIALAAVSPWPFGSTPSWAVGFITWISLATAVVVSLAQVRRGALCLPRAPLWPVAILVALGFMQLVPLPAGPHALLALGLGGGLWRQAASAPSASAPSASPAALVAFGASAIMVMAVLLSMSRGGALGVLSGIAVLAVVDFMTARHRDAMGKVLVPVGLRLLPPGLAAAMPGESPGRP